MKTAISILVFLFLCAGISNGQTTKTVGGTGADYSRLQLAFAAINSGIFQGQIILQITGNTSETAAASLNASGSGNANYTSVLIYPTGAFSISSAYNGAVIDLNGADNVTIDGRMNGTGTPNSLSIAGTSTGNGAAGIRFVNSSENNTIKYCNITASSLSSSIGIVSFGGSNTGNGNDNNTLENCNLTCSGSNRPYNGIISSGTGGRENNGCIIRNNNIYNTFQTGVSSNGININSASVGFTISGNSIYEEAPFNATANALSYNAIRISTTNEHVISGNYIGGNAPLCAGTWSFTSPYAVYFCAIYAYAGSGAATTISNNIISGMNYSSTEDNPWDGIFLYSGNFDVTGNTIGATTGNGSITSTTPVALATATMSGGVVTGITLVNGGSGYTTAPTVTFSVSGSTTPATANATISGGIITSINLLTGGVGYTSTPSVIFDGQSNNYSTSHGMINNSIGTVNITANNIGSITTVGSDYYSHGFESVYVRGASGTTTLSNNLIGSLTTANSIYVSSSASSSTLKQDVYGLFCNSATGTNIISGNTIANLTNNYSGIISMSRTRGIAVIAGSNTIENNTVRNLSTPSKQSTGGSTASVIGITQSSTAAGTTQTISGNTLSDLSNTSTTAKVYVSGIYYNGPTTGTQTISSNFIHSLSIASSDNLSDLEGIELAGGTFTCANNIVNLGVGIAGGYLINGIWDESNASSARSILFNSVYIGGTVSSGGSTTAALNNQYNTATRDFRNNILFNARSGGTGKHYSLYIKNAGTTGLTSDYNDYFVSGTNGVLAYVGSDKGTLALLQAATGGDAHSLNTNPNFSSAGGTSAINYSASASLNGVSVTEITTDYYGITRGSTPKMGALEQNGNVWQGTTNTDFGTPANWSTGAVPSSGADIIFATSPANDCVLDANRTVGSITNGSSKNLLVNGKTLTVNGSINFTSSGKINASTASSVLKFAGSASQTIQAAVLVSNSVAGLEIANASGVALNGDLTVSGVLTLTSGVFAVGANTLTIAGTPVRTSGSIDASNAGATLDFANSSALTLPASVFSADITNLTISGTGGITAGSDITVNGVLNLAANNPSNTKGLMEMTISYVNYPGTTISQYLNSYKLNMGATATTFGTGDVTGTVKRATIVANTSYTFGHQYTTISLTTGTMPTSLSVTITIGTSPYNTRTPSDIINDAIKRTYEIVPVGGSDCYVTANFHYLDSELTSSNSPYHPNTEQKLTTMDYDIQGGLIVSDEHGRANYDYTNNYIGLSSVPISYFIQIPTTHEWRTIFALRDYGEGYYTWDGSQHTTTWTDAENWTVSVGGSGVPTTSGHVIIPSAASTGGYSPALPSGITINTLSIENGGVLTMGSNTLTIQNSFSGGWEDQNPYGNDPGISTVIFAVPSSYSILPHTTISGNARFYNVQIAQDADVTIQAGSTMRIAGSITKTGSGTGKWTPDVFDATVEYNGENQTIIHPDGSPDYHNLILSGIGTKSLPSGLNMHGDFIITGTTEAVASGPITAVGTMSVGQLAKYTAGAYTHTNGNFIIYSDATGTGSLIATSNFSGTVERWMTGDIWHLISPSATGQTASDFITDAANGIASNTNNYGLSPYIESTDNWEYFKVAGITGSLNEAGKGYQVLRNADGIVSFKGTLAGGNQTIGITKGSSTYGWNLIGNPYPCALDVKLFLDANAAKVDKIPIDQSFLGIYVADVADVTNFGYVPINYSNGANTLKLASGEGFFVKSVAGGGSVNFTTDMKSHTSDAFKSAAIQNGFNLIAESADDRMSTSVKYIPQMTAGLDPGWDAGLFNGSPMPFALFTHLVEDNGIDFTIQCLPDYDYENLVVPVGLTAKQGTMVNFSLAEVTIPAGYKVFLEDKVNQKFTRIDEQGSIYSVQLNANNNGTGQFFLHTKQAITGIDDGLSNTVFVVPMPQHQKIRVSGLVNLPAQATV
ncbi:MAG TPA: hypothetical protein VLQ91_00635, partial [Draconibacterium sp.]|nr:hypothetical protein [Draconibacterium sp.]